MSSSAPRRDITCVSSPLVALKTKNQRVRSLLLTNSGPVNSTENLGPHPLDILLYESVWEAVGTNGLILVLSSLSVKSSKKPSLCAVVRILGLLKLRCSGCSLPRSLLRWLSSFMPASAVMVDAVW